MFQPQYYHFESNRTYVVFAKNAERAGIYRQLRASHTGKADQGALLCLDNKPVLAESVSEALWNELTFMLKDTDVSNVTYAIRQLDQMSGGQDRYDSTQDFDRTNVLTLVHDLMTNSDSRIAQAAITVVGSQSIPVRRAHDFGWRPLVAPMCPLSKMDLKMRNIGGERYWKILNECHHRKTGRDAGNRHSCPGSRARARAARGNRPLGGR